MYMYINFNVLLSNAVCLMIHPFTAALYIEHAAHVCSLTGSRCACSMLSRGSLLHSLLCLFRAHVLKIPAKDWCMHVSP